MKKIMLAITLFFSVGIFFACGTKLPEFYTITFVQAGQQDIVKTVNSGEDLKDIPTPVSKQGYSVSWNVTDFSNISNDMTVTAQEKANNYVITYDLVYDSYGTLESNVQSVKFDEEYELLNPTLTPGYKLSGWKIKDTGEMLDNTGVWNIAKNIELEAVWSVCVLTFDLRNAEILGLENQIGGFIESKIASIGELTSLPQLTVLDPDSSFVGWLIEGTTTIITDEEYIFTDNVNLIAVFDSQWSPLA